MDATKANKQIAKNTLYLYLRMIVTIVVNLIAVRMLWQALGIDDYGIYSLMGGIVWLFGFISGSMIGATQRYMSYELGRNNQERLNKVFTISMKVHYWLAFILVVVAEVAGIWFFRNLNIPPGRTVAAIWVYECSIASFVMTIFSVPYNAAIVAHEKMNVYGWLGILEVVLKLVIIFITDWLPTDHLITYAILLFAVTALMRIICGIYCKAKFPECTLRKYKDPQLSKDLISFGKWTMVGAGGFSLRDYGMGIVLNLFFNVAVNAARGMANQVGNVIIGFATNFTMAMNPQITKRYAMGELEEMLKLVFSGSKYALLLMGIVVIPLIIEMEPVLTIWLGENITPLIVGFTRLALVLALIESVANPLVTALQATGKIKLFQITISLLMISTFPTAWIALKLGGSPYVVYYIILASSALGIALRTYLLHRMIKFSYFDYIKTAYVRAVPALLLGFGAGWGLHTLFSTNIWGVMSFALVCVFVYLLIVFFIGLNNSERKFVLEKVRIKRP